MKTTIKDVAKEAGVAFKTVSRVINNEPNVSAETREKVEKAIRKLNFTPNLIARSLTNKMIMNIGVVVGWPISSFYVSQLLSETLKACTEKQYNLTVFSTSDNTEEAEARILKAANGGLINGLILDTVSASSKSLIGKLEETRIPFVIIHPNNLAEHSSQTYVTIDDFLGAKNAVSYLISLGHRNIGCIVGNSFFESQARYQGYKSTLEENGQTCPSVALPLADNLSAFSVGFTYTKELIRTNPELTAVFCETDEMALGAINALMEEGKRVPDDVSVIGFDDNNAASMIIPSLTTIHQPIDEIASKAVELLVARINNYDIPYEHITLSTELVVRESTRAI